MGYLMRLRTSQKFSIAKLRLQMSLGFIQDLKIIFDMINSYYFLELILGVAALS
jgi:hypothetical protein